MSLMGAWISFKHLKKSFWITLLGAAVFQSCHLSTYRLLVIKRIVIMWICIPARMARPGVIPYADPLIHPVTYFNLSRELMDHAATIRWCQTMKLVSASKLCSCGRGCTWRRHNNPEGMGWRCPRKGCRKEVTLRKGTF